MAKDSMAMGRIDLGSDGLGKWKDLRLEWVVYDTSAPAFFSVGSKTLMWVTGWSMIKFSIPTMNDHKFQ